MHPKVRQWLTEQSCYYVHSTPAPYQRQGPVRRIDAFVAAYNAKFHSFT